MPGSCHLFQHGAAKISAGPESTQEQSLSPVSCSDWSMIRLLYFEISKAPKSPPHCRVPVSTSHEAGYYVPQPKNHLPKRRKGLIFFCVPYLASWSWVQKPGGRQSSQIGVDCASGCGTLAAAGAARLPNRRKLETRRIRLSRLTRSAIAAAASQSVSSSSAVSVASSSIGSPSPIRSGGRGCCDRLPNLMKFLVRLLASIFPEA